MLTLTPNKARSGPKSKSTYTGSQCWRAVVIICPNNTPSCRNVDLPRPSAIVSEGARVPRAPLSSGSNPWTERSHLPDNKSFYSRTRGGRLWRRLHSSQTIRTVSAPDTSNTEVDVQLRHVISCAGLSDAAVTGVLEQRPLSEPAAHKEAPLTQGLAVLHYGAVENVPVYQPVNGDVTGTWGTELDFISHRGGKGGPQRHAVHLRDVDACV